MRALKAATMIVAALAAFGAMTPAHAQAPTFKVGYIDMEDVFNRADARKTGEDKVTDLANTLKTRLQTLRDSTMLPSATWQDYRKLLEIEKPTADDSTKINTIKTQLTGLDTELKSLQQTPAPTDAQKNRLNELNGNTTANAGNLQNAASDYDAQISKLQSDLRNSIVADIAKAAAAVAKSQNVAVVLNKSIAMGEDAPQLLVVAGGVDITDDVVKQVNSSKK